MNSIALNIREHCPLCESANCNVLCRLAFNDMRMVEFLQEFYGARYQPVALEGENYEVRKCRQCGFIHQAGVLNDPGMSALYEHWIDNKRSLEKKRHAKTRLFRQYARTVGAIAHFFPQAPHTVDVLEFGMGWGYWARMAQAHGYRVIGLELSRKRIAHASTLGVEAVRALPDHVTKFHFIFANQVFEHLPDPLRSLRDLSQHLAVDGVVYLRVPDGRGIERQLARSGWSPRLDAIHPLEHINCFTRDTLIKLADQCGLRVAPPPLQLSAGRLLQSLKREVTDRFLTTHLFFQKT